MSTISLCMVVRDEEPNIRRCLDSIKDYVNEMVIVDTGSSDRTKEICSEYGASVFAFDWKNNFADARNFGLEKAQGDWILWLDADEAADMTDFPSLQACLDKRENSLILVPMQHFYGQDPKNDQQVYFSSATRLIRNKIGIRFAGKIHESLVSDAFVLSPPAEANRSLRILHYGYMESAFKKKETRNINLLLEEKAQHPNNAWLDYHLAAEYYRARMYSEAYQKVDTALAGFLRNNILPPSLAYKLKYDILLTTGNFEAAYPGIEMAAALYPDYVDLHFYRGIVQCARGEYGKAEQAFSYSLVLGESNVKYLILAGTGSFLSLYCLGLCYKKLEKAAQSEEAFRQTRSLYPAFDPAASWLQNLSEYKIAIT